MRSQLIMCALRSGGAAALTVGATAAPGKTTRPGVVAAVRLAPLFAPPSAPPSARDTAWTVGGTAEIAYRLVQGEAHAGRTQTAVDAKSAPPGA